jgi:DNA-binding LacI/PurR family transcriptional regulator
MGVLRSRRADGILLVVAPSTGTDHIQGAIDAGIAVVCLDRVPKGIQVDAVTVNNLKGAEMCVRHLIQSGHTRIGIITGPLVLQTARDRFRGYENVLRENGLTLDRGLVREGNFRVDSGYRLGKDLCLSGARPSALFVTNGMMGAGVVKALRELGVEYPRDMSLAVFDGLPWSDIFRPDVTSVVQPSYEMGFRGAELLIRRLQGKLPGRKVKAQLELELKVGDSAASRVSERSAQP